MSAPAPARRVYRTTRQTIWTKDGRVIAPHTRIDVIGGQDGEWRTALLVDEPANQGLITISERDLQVHTELCPA